MRVYVITSGDYSDYCIMGVTLDKENAERYVELYNGKSEYYQAKIEEYETDQFGHGNRLPWFVFKDRQSTSVDLGREPCDDVVKENAYGAIYVSVYAEDESHALKIAYDKFAQYMAEKEGIG